MPQSRKTQLRLNLGDMDLRARVTFATNRPDSPMLEDFRAAAVKRYQGYLYDSMRCGFRPILRRADYRTLNIAYGYQSRPSPRTKRLLNALPRLDTGCPQRPQRHEDSVPDYFSLYGGWERWVQPPSNPDLYRNFDYYKFIRADIEYLLKSKVRYYTVTNRNIVHLANQDPVERYARYAREVQFYNSLESEKFGLKQLMDLMEAYKPGFGGVMPGWDEWRYWTTVQTVERVREERQRRGEWAIQFEDMNLLVL